MFVLIVISISFTSGVAMAAVDDSADEEKITYWGNTGGVEEDYSKDCVDIANNNVVCSYQEPPTNKQLFILIGIGVAFMGALFYLEREPKTKKTA